MNDYDSHPRNYLMIRLPVKWIAFFILGISLIAGVATIVTRFEQLQYLAANYYHPYLIQAGLSDSFCIWYFLLTESLLALAFAVTGGIIALYGPATWMTIFAAIALMLFGVSVPPPLHALVVQQGALELPLRLLRALGLALFVIFFYIFPDGLITTSTPQSRFCGDFTGSASYYQYFRVIGDPDWPNPGNIQYYSWF
jgi:hypothetical protein